MNYKIALKFICSILLLVFTLFLLTSQELSIVKSLSGLTTLSIFVLLWTHIGLRFLNINLKKNILLSFYTLIFCFLVVESSLRFCTHKYLTYFELAHGNYMSYYEIYKHNQLSYSPNDTLCFESKGEYKHFFTTNSLGYCDKEWIKTKNKDEYRILCLGDSFTLGMGTSMNSGWVNILRNNLILGKKSIVTLNAGISGSDIVNESYKAEKLSTIYQPDAVILCLNVSDIVDIYLRGNERFFCKKKLHRANPIGRLENLYKFSFIYRVWLHEIKNRNFLFLSVEEEKELEKKSIDKITKELNQIKQHCSNNGISFFFFIHPHGMELKDGEYLYENFPNVRNGFEEISADLMLNFQNIEYISEDFRELYHKKDRHFNSLGYKYMGEFVVKEFEKIMSKNI